MVNFETIFVFKINTEEHSLNLISYKVSKIPRKPFIEEGQNTFDGILKYSSSKICQLLLLHYESKK